MYDRKPWKWEHEGRYLPVVGEAAAAGQQIGPEEVIGGLVVLDGDNLLFLKKYKSLREIYEYITQDNPAEKVVLVTF